MAPSTFVHRSFDDPDEDVTTHLISAIAEARGCPPIELDVVLNDHVNTDTVEQLISDRSHDGYLTFDVEHHHVMVFSTGDVVVFG